MYEVLIADDNKIIRDALKKFINWRELGFTISGEACDGAEAYEQIRNHPPDAMLLDIRMPVMSGLELMDALKADNRELQIVILSAYDEFTYAKKALEYGAVDYVLKPFNKEKISEIFARIKDKLDRNSQHKLRSDEWAVLKRDRLFSAIMKSGVERQSVIDMFKQIGVASTCEHYALIGIRLDSAALQSADAEGESDRLQASIRSIAQETFVVSALNSVYFSSPEQAYALIGYNGSSDEVVILGRSMIAAINERLVLDVKVFYSLDIPSLADIPANGKRISSMFAYRLYFRKNHMNDARFPETIPADAPPLPFREIPVKANAMISTGDYYKIYEYIESVFALVKNGNMLADEEVYSVYMGFVSGIQYYSEQAGVRMEPMPELQRVSFSDFHKFDTIEEVKEQLHDMFKRAFDCGEQIRGSRSGKVIEAAKGYILEHYHEEVTLNHVARHVFMHPIYFCTLFKKETGETFNNYLTQIRLDKAYELIKHSEMKIYEVSGAVGYKSPKHFSRLFKERFGIMPKDYKNKTIVK